MMRAILMAMVMAVLRLEILEAGVLGFLKDGGGDRTTEYTAVQLWVVVRAVRLYDCGIVGLWDYGIV